MINTDILYTASRPAVGAPVSYRGAFVGKITRVEGNLCWHTGSDAGPFIWRFHDGVNALHDWPGKVDKSAPCPGK